MKNPGAKPWYETVERLSGEDPEVSLVIADRRVKRPQKARPGKRRANRQNALLSTGPKTEERKAVSSMNNLRHGHYRPRHGFQLIRRRRRRFKELALALRTEHAPQTPTESLLVERMIESFYMSSRAIALQSAALESGDDRRLSLLLLPNDPRTRLSEVHERARKA